MKSYVFHVVIEPDEDVWRAYIPELEAKGAATWDPTRDEALRNIQEVAQLVIEELLEDGEVLPPGVTVKVNKEERNPELQVLGHQLEQKGNPAGASATADKVCTG